MCPGAEATLRPAMEVRFGRSAPFSIGVEEEFQLLSPESYELVSRFDEVTEAAGYVGLMEKMQWVAERELIFGLHVHVGMRSGDEAILVANALRTHLPELLALSANSPFWHGRDTGLASTRIKVFDPFPRSGLPPTFASFRDFELLVERGVKTGCFEDYTERPAREAVRALVELARPAARRLGCGDELDEVERLLARGVGADEQR